MHDRDIRKPLWRAPKRTGPTGLSPDGDKQATNPATPEKVAQIKDAFQEVSEEELKGLVTRPSRR